MSYSDTLKAVKVGQVNDTYEVGTTNVKTDFGVFIPSEFAKIQILAINNVNNPVWHLEAGYDSIDPPKKGFLRFDLQSTVSGVLFQQVSMNIVSQKVVSFTLIFNEFSIKHSEVMSVDKLVEMLGLPLKDILDIMISDAENNELKAQITKFKNTFKCSYDPYNEFILDEFGFSQEDHKILDDIVDSIGKEIH
jgi:hypothetical protein